MYVSVSHFLEYHNTVLYKKQMYPLLSLLSNTKMNVSILLLIILSAHTTFACLNVEYSQHEDCGKYYIHIKVEAECPQGLQFNPEIKACDVASRTECEIETSTVGDDSENNVTDDEITSTTIIQETTMLDDSPVSSVVSETTSFENRTDDMITTEVTSENNTISDIVTTEINNVNTTEPLEEDSSTITIETSSDSQLTISTKQPQEIVQECPKTNEGDVVFIPHDNCDKFYACDWGNKIEMSCPTGLHFNPTLNVCDWPINANCNEKVSTANKETDATISAITDDDNELNSTNRPETIVDDASEAASEASSVSDTDIIQTTLESIIDNNSTNNDETTATTEDNHKTTRLTSTENILVSNTNDLDEPTVDNSTTTVLPEITNNECPPLNGEYPVFFVHENCEKYYVCDWGQKMEMNCSKGLHFNPSLNVCDWPNNVHCISTSTDTDLNQEKTTTDIPSKSSQTDKPLIIVSTTEGSDLEDDRVCSTTNHGEFSRHELCDKYYVCDWGIKVEMSCPKGLHFNPTINVCDWPSNVRCEESLTLE